MGDELTIEDIQLGTGKEAVKGTLIATQYCGFLEDGTVFDSSINEENPFNVLSTPAELSKAGIAAR